MRVQAFQINCISIGAAALALAVTILLVHAANTADVRVVDGDTLQIDGVTYRLYGIDAPERKQVCARPQGQWWCGEFATRELETLASSGPVRCEPLNTALFVHFFKPSCRPRRETVEPFHSSCFGISELREAIPAAPHQRK